MLGALVSKEIDRDTLSGRWRLAAIAETAPIGVYYFLLRCAAVVVIYIDLFRGVGVIARGGVTVN